MEKLPELTVLTIDRFLAWRNPKLRRATRSGLVIATVIFFAFYITRVMLNAILPAVVTLYRFEDVPKAFRPDQVRAVLEHIYKDETRAGLRDYDWGEAGTIVRPLPP